MQQCDHPYEALSLLHYVVSKSENNEIEKMKEIIKLYHILFGHDFCDSLVHTINQIIKLNLTTVQANSDKYSVFSLESVLFGTSVYNQ